MGRKGGGTRVSSGALAGSAGAQGVAVGVRVAQESCGAAQGEVPGVALEF